MLTLNEAGLAYSHLTLFAHENAMRSPLYRDPPLCTMWEHALREGHKVCSTLRTIPTFQHRATCCVSAMHTCGSPFVHRMTKVGDFR